MTHDYKKVLKESLTISLDQLLFFFKERQILLQELNEEKNKNNKSQKITEIEQKMEEYKGLINFHLQMLSPCFDVVETLAPEIGFTSRQLKDLYNHQLVMYEIQREKRN